MTATLLSTKFYIPPTRTEFVPRPRLIERLDGGLHRKLTLISAPAGFGKTTLVSEWVHDLRHSPALASGASVHRTHTAPVGRCRGVQVNAPGLPWHRPRTPHSTTPALHPQRGASVVRGR